MRHRPENHERDCYCGERATAHVMYGSGCGNVCDKHAAMIARVKGGRIHRSGPVIIEEVGRRAYIPYLDLDPVEAEKVRRYLTEQAERIARVGGVTVSRMESGSLGFGHPVPTLKPGEFLRADGTIGKGAKPESGSMPFVEDDGGRALAGFKGQTGDCAARAVAIAAELPYREVYDRLAELGKRHERRGKRKRSISHPRTGVYRPTMHRFLVDELGWTWTPTMQIGQGCKVHLRADELPEGRLIVSLSKHYAAVVDGVLHDTHDSSRDGTRCVYGIWRAAR